MGQKSRVLLYAAAVKSLCFKLLSAKEGTKKGFKDPLIITQCGTWRKENLRNDGESLCAASEASAEEKVQKSFD